MNPNKTTKITAPAQKKIYLYSKYWGRHDTPSDLRRQIEWYEQRACEAVQLAEKSTSKTERMYAEKFSETCLAAAQELKKRLSRTDLHEVQP
jgi:hypothetical protein